MAQEHLRDYERPVGYGRGLPDIFIHKIIVEEFGLPDVDYDNQARLHREEIPGSPARMPVTYIDMQPPKYDNLALAPRPRTKLSHDSSRKGNEIFVNLRTFEHSGQNAVTPATTARLSREIILQSAKRSPSGTPHSYTPENTGRT